MHSEHVFLHDKPHLPVTLPRYWTSHHKFAFNIGNNNKAYDSSAIFKSNLSLQKSENKVKSYYIVTKHNKI